MQSRCLLYLYAYKWYYKRLCTSCNKYFGIAICLERIDEKCFRICT